MPRLTKAEAARAAALEDMEPRKLACRADGHHLVSTFGWGAVLRDRNDRRRKVHHRNNGTWEKVCVRDGVGCGYSTVVVTGPQAQRITASSRYDEDYELPGPKPEGGTRAEARRVIMERARRGEGT